MMKEPVTAAFVGALAAGTLLLAGIGVAAFAFWPSVKEAAIAAVKQQARDALGPLGKLL